MRCSFLFIIGLVALTLVPLVMAQQTYTQPMYPIDWTSSAILVSVPVSPSWAVQSFQQAMQNWNQAQTWFLATYESTHQNAKYTLQLAQSGEPAQVTVQYVTDTKQDWDGLTYNNGKQMSIVLSRYESESQSYAISDVEILAEHELGACPVFDLCVLFSG